jgi:hypothetical protein
MKRSLLFIITLLVVMGAVAQAPQKFNYQSILRDSDGNLLVNQQVGMLINILKDDPSGPQVYTETQTPTTNSNGLLSISIGGGDGFDTINWSHGAYFLEIQTDPMGGTNYTISGTSQLLSVPYALHANTADSLTGGGGHYVGELYGGGIVFYVDPQGEHGLILSLDYLGTAQWGFFGTDVPGCESAVDGEANTADIIAAGGSPTEAAGMCVAYTAGGYNDWYLPSRREWHLLSEPVVIIIDDILKNDGNPNTNGFAENYDENIVENYYWLSYEYENGHSENYAPAVTSPNFGGGAGHQKDQLRRVRAIRKF